VQRELYVTSLQCFSLAFQQCHKFVCLPERFSRKTENPKLVVIFYTAVFPCLISNIKPSITEQSITET